MTVSAIPVVSVDAEDNLQSYPYAMFASSYSDGAITVNSNNFCVNCGTYNYCSDQINSELHQKFDIDTYFKWGNVKGLFYGNSTDERDSNERYYNKNANESIYSYWKIRFN